MDEQSDEEAVLTVRLVLCVCVCVHVFQTVVHALERDPVSVCVCPATGVIIYCWVEDERGRWSVHSTKKGKHKMRWKSQKLLPHWKHASWNGNISSPLLNCLKEQEWEETEQRQLWLLEGAGQGEEERQRERERRGVSGTGGWKTGLPRQLNSNELLLTEGGIESNACCLFSLAESTRHNNMCRVLTGGAARTKALWKPGTQIQRGR